MRPDIYDGVLACKFGVVSPALRRYDSITDNEKGRPDGRPSDRAETSVHAAGLTTAAFFVFADIFFRLR